MQDNDQLAQQLRDAQYITARLRNVSGSAEGTLLPPRQQGSFRVPFASNLKIIQITTVLGGTQFTLQWDEPTTYAAFIGRYNVYYSTIAINSSVAGGQLQGPFTSKGSPCTLTITTTLAQRVVFYVQTELVSGLKSDILSSPTCTGLTVAAQISSAAIPGGAILKSQIAPNTAGALDGYDATGTPIVIAPVATVGAFLTNTGVAAPPAYSSAAGDVSGTVGSLVLATVNANTGPWGDATHVPQITLDGKGRATAAANVLITGTVPGGAAGGALNGTYPNPGLVNPTNFLLARTTVADLAYTVLVTDYLIVYTSLTLARIVTIPAALAVNRQSWIVKDEAGTAGANNLTLTPGGGLLIDGAATKVINANFGVVRFYSNGANFFTY